MVKEALMGGNGGLSALLQKKMNAVSQNVSESTFHKMFCKSFKTVIN